MSARMIFKAVKFHAFDAKTGGFVRVELIAENLWRWDAKLPTAKMQLDGTFLASYGDAKSARAAKAQGELALQKLLRKDEEACRARRRMVGRYR